MTGLYTVFGGSCLHKKENLTLSWEWPKYLWRTPQVHAVGCYILQNFKILLIVWQAMQHHDHDMWEMSVKDVSLHDFSFQPEDIFVRDAKTGIDILEPPPAWVMKSGMQCSTIQNTWRSLYLGVSILMFTQLWPFWFENTMLYSFVTKGVVW